jgi:4-amino-4-deoxy-L-arabinose transferase-like glycosyltransferase
MGMKRISSIVLVAVAGLLLGQAAHVVWRGPIGDVAPVTWASDVSWIGPTKPGYQAYFRNTFYIDSVPSSAWLRVSADSSFDLYVNGRLVSREDTPTNNAKGLGDGLKSQIFQPLNDTRVYRAPIESTLAITNVPDWKLCVYEDIAKYLTAGKNVVAISVGCTLTTPRVAIEGHVHITPEREITLATGKGQWLCSTRPESRDQQIWYERDFQDQYWSNAARIGAVQETIYSRLSPAVMDLAPHGRWITGPASNLGEIYLRGTWNVAAAKQPAFLRVSANVAASVMINGRLIGDPEQTKESVGKLLIYDVSRLLRNGANTVAVKLSRPLATEQPTLAGESPEFFLDGWVDGPNGEITSPFATDASWVAFTELPASWYQGDGKGAPALVLGTQGLNGLSREFRGDATNFDYVSASRGFGIFLLLGLGLALAFVAAIARWWLPVGEDQKVSSWRTSLAVIVPGTVGMIVAAVLAHRYSENEIALFLTDYRAALISLAVFCLGTSLSLFAIWMAARRRNDSWAQGWKLLPAAVLAGLTVAILWAEPILLNVAIGILVAGAVITLLSPTRVVHIISERIRTASAHQLVVATILAILVVGGFALRSRALPVPDLSPDENTSLDVIRGIMRTGGAPEGTSGIWYTRSPLFHYAGALWLEVFGDTVNAAHLFSVLFGAALLPLAFAFSKQLTKRDDLSLLVVALMACDQWLIVLSRAIRFYVVVQFLTLLCFYLFYKGFVERGKPFYRYTFFIVLTAAMLNQEMMVTLVPIFGLGMLMFYRPFSLRKDWPIVVAAVATLSVFFFDQFVFYVKCLTPPIALSTTTDSIAKPHLRFVTGFLGGFFAGSARVHIVYSFFFFAGFIYSLARREWWRVFLFASVLIYLIELTVLIRQVSVRYTSPAYPLFLILAVTSAFELARGLASAFGNGFVRPAVLRPVLSVMVLLTLLAGQQYAKVIWPNDEHLVKGTTEVTRYIRDHASKTDIVVSPAAPAAAVELGGLNYFLSSNVLYFDIPYRDGNLVRDRWGGGELVSNPEAFSRIFEKASRVWIYYDEVSESKMSPEMRYYLRTTGRPVMEGYAATLRLWDRERDPFPFADREGRDVGTY